MAYTEIFQRCKDEAANGFINDYSKVIQNISDYFVSRFSNVHFSSKEMNVSVSSKSYQDKGLSEVIITILAFKLKMINLDRRKFCDFSPSIRNRFPSHFAKAILYSNPNSPS